MASRSAVNGSPCNHCKLNGAHDLSSMGHIRKRSSCPGSPLAEPSHRRFVSLLPFRASRIEPHHEDLVGE